MKNKKFDCVEMKRAGAQKILQKTSKMSKEEELKFWQEQTKNLKTYQKELLRKTKPEADISI